MTSSLRAASLASLAAGLALIVACSSDDDHGHDHHNGGHSSTYPTCDAIIKRCHPLDIGVGKISECHVFAHEATNDAECVAKRDECFAACVASDGGTTDASTD